MGCKITLWGKGLISKSEDLNLNPSTEKILSGKLSSNSTIMTSQYQYMHTIADRKVIHINTDSHKLKKIYFKN